MSADAYENFKSLLAPISKKRPIHLCIGNHDHREDFRAAFTGFGVSAQNMLWAGRDGSMLGHAALVLAVALALWWRAFGPGVSRSGAGAPPA